jgi:hypothetical protein
MESMLTEIFARTPKISGVFGLVGVIFFGGIAVLNYRPFHSGLRLLMKASMPSFLSSVEKSK